MRQERGPGLPRLLRLDSLLVALFGVGLGLKRGLRGMDAGFKLGVRGVDLGVEYRVRGCQGHSEGNMHRRHEKRQMADMLGHLLLGEVRKRPVARF